MFNLVLKDLFIMKRDLIKQAILWIIYIIILQFFGATATYIVIPYLVTSSVIMCSCGFGERNDVDVMLNSLPVNRKEIVFGKYLSVLNFFIISFVINVVLCTVIKLSGFSNINRFVNLEDIVICFVFISVYSSIYILLYLWLGYFKSKIINEILTTFMFLSLIIVVMLVTIINNGTAVKSIMDFVLMPNFKLFMCILSLIFSCVMIFLSMVISLKVYANREL